MLYAVVGAALSWSSWTAPPQFSCARSRVLAACAPLENWSLAKEQLLGLVGTEGCACSIKIWDHHCLHTTSLPPHDITASTRQGFRLSSTRPCLFCRPSVRSLLIDSTAQETVEEHILELSANNPTAEPARSILMNGKWEVLYAGSPGAGFLDSPTRPLALALYAAPLSPSVLAQGLAKLPFADASLGTVVITIRSPEAGQPRVAVETSVAFLGNTQPLMLRANLSPRSSVALREDFVEVEVLGQRTLLPGPLAASRTLFVAYLDDDMLIVRDDAGQPSVLRRAVKFPDATPLSVEDDDNAPGAS